MCPSGAATVASRPLSKWGREARREAHTPSLGTYAHSHRARALFGFWRCRHCPHHPPRPPRPPRAWSGLVFPVLTSAASLRITDGLAKGPPSVAHYPRTHPAPPGPGAARGSCRVASRCVAFKGCSLIGGAGRPAAPDWRIGCEPERMTRGGYAAPHRAAPKCALWSIRLRGLALRHSHEGIGITPTPPRPDSAGGPRLKSMT